MPDTAEAPPQPPTKFRCNRGRMILIIRVTLHHVAPAQINLTTTRTHIKLDTLKARRKFVMDRVYPRGVECDDSRTTAKMEGHVLVVEMPITKLPPLVTPSPAPIAEAPVAKKRKRASAVPETSDPTEDTEVVPPKKAKQKRTSAAPETSDATEDTEVVPPKKAKQLGGKSTSSGSRRADSSGSAAGPSDNRMLELLNDATQAAEQRREESLSKMRRFEEAEDEAKRKAADRQAEREIKKAKLLDSFRRQQEQTRAASKVAKKAQQKTPKPVPALPTSAATPVVAKARKRVSFSNEAVEGGRSR